LLSGGAITFTSDTKHDTDEQHEHQESYSKQVIWMYRERQKELFIEIDGISHYQNRCNAQQQTNAGNVPAELNKAQWKSNAKDNGDSNNQEQSKH
jgi:hypothetical protein